MTNLLVTFKANYADEFDVFGFALPAKDFWEEYLDHLKEDYTNAKEINWYFGTNEELVWRSNHERTGWDRENDKPIIAYRAALEKLLSRYKVTEIDEPTFNMLSTLFDLKYPTACWGHFPWVGW